MAIEAARENRAADGQNGLQSVTSQERIEFIRRMGRRSAATDADRLSSLEREITALTRAWAPGRTQQERKALIEAVAYALIPEWKP